MFLRALYRVIENSFLSSSLPLKYDLVLGPHNGVSRRTGWLVERELEAVNHPFIKNKEIRNR